MPFPSNMYCFQDLHHSYNDAGMPNVSGRGIKGARSSAPERLRNTNANSQLSISLNPPINYILVS